jgi:Cdc6-like AAA superfamily ATPase
MMHEYLSVLVDSLHKANRLVSRRVFILHSGLLKLNSEKAGSDDSLTWIEPFCLMSAGGTILVKIPYISFGLSQSPKSEQEMRRVRYLSVVEKLFSLNKGRAQFVFAFDSLYSEEGIKLALVETFPHDPFVTFFAKGVKASFAREFLEAEARRNQTEVDESLFETLTKKAEYTERELRMHLDGWSRQRLIAAEYPAYGAIRPIDMDQLRSKTSALRQLDSLTGLAETKEQVKRVIASIEFQRHRHAKGMDTRPPCLHMMFMGNPGTGKTTVARLVGEIFAIEGIIPCGRFYEVSPTTLKGEASWADTFEQARGSVLFIDEAYTLGDNAVDQLIPYLENYREDTVVIFAGYKEEMKKFLTRNCGLVSRIPHHIDFPNYTHAELGEITDSVLIEKNYAVSADARRMLHRELRRFRFLEGNARDIRTIVEKAILEAAVRLQAELHALSSEKLRTLEASDFAPVLRRIGKEHRRRMAVSVYGSPLFIVPATHVVKAAGQIAGSRLSGRRMTKRDALALALESAVSVSTELVMHAISKGWANQER